MSKEKLKEILNLNISQHGRNYFFNNEVIDIMALAYNQALEDAADIAEVKHIIVKDVLGVQAVVDKRSIQKLKI